MCRNRQQAILAAIARREWLLQMLALGAAACRRAEDRAYARDHTLIAAVPEGYTNERPLTPDEIAEFLVYLPLVRIDERGERRACLATEWTHSADYLEWTYRLRPGVRWHDGKPVTVDDVKFTLDLHARPDSPVLGLQTTCTVHDASTFTVRGVNWSRGMGADSRISVVPMHLLKDLDYQKWYEWDFWLRPVGNGPYRYLRYQPGTMVELEANPEYYKGKPTIERVVLKFTGGASLTELLSGKVDAIWLNDSSRLSTIAADDRFQTYWELRPSYGAILWQNEHPVFRDPNVRRALSLAINRRELLQVLNLPSPLALVDGVYTDRQVRRGEGAAPPYDPAEARRLLEASGWRPRNGDGVRERNGQAFHFTALTQPETGGFYDSMSRAALYVQDQLRDVGVRMEVQPLELATLRSRVRAREFEAVVCRSGIVGGYTLGFLGVEPSPIGYQNPELAKLLDRLRTTADPEVEDRAHRDVSELLRRDQPFAFLHRMVSRHIVHGRVKGLSAPWRANPLSFAEDLWLENRPER